MTEINIRLKKKPVNQGPRNSHRETSQTILEVELTEDMDSASGENDDIEPTKAKAKVLRGFEESWGYHKIDGEFEEIELVNYDTDLSGSSGDRFLVVRLNGTWRPIAATGSFQLYQTETDGFRDAENEDDGPVYNAHKLNNEDKKVYIHGQYYSGFAFRNSVVACTKIAGIIYAIGGGIQLTYGVLTTNVSSQNALCDLTSAPGNHSVLSEDPVVVYVSNTRWNGLKAGHPVTLTWDGSKFCVTAIQGEFASGTFGNQITVNEASYSIFETVGRDIITGTPVYCCFDSGSYRVLSVGCQ